MRTSIVALLLLAPLTLAAACTTEEGTTPDCVANVTEDGVQPHNSGCHQFPVCTTGKPPAPVIVDPSAVDCCGENAGQSINCNIVFCRLGFGVPRSELTPGERVICLGGDGSGAGGAGGDGGAGGGGGDVGGGGG